MCIVSTVYDINVQLILVKLSIPSVGGTLPTYSMVPVNPSQINLLPTSYSPAAGSPTVAIATLMSAKHREMVVNLDDDHYHTETIESVNVTRTRIRIRV